MFEAKIEFSINSQFLTAYYLYHVHYQVCKRNAISCFHSRHACGMPLLFHNTEVHPLFVASPCQRLDIYFLGRPSFLLGEYNLVFFITYPLRHKTYTKPLYFHKSKRNISYSQRTQQKNQPGSSSPLSKCQSKPYEVSLFVPQTGYVPEYAILAQQRNI